MIESKLVLFVVCISAFFLEGIATADSVAFSNYDSQGDNSTSWGSSVGLDIASAQYRTSAQSFTSLATGKLSQFDISISGLGTTADVNPDAAVRISLHADGGDVPASEIWSTEFKPSSNFDFGLVQFIDFGQWGFAEALIPGMDSVELGDDAPVLISGQRYWLAAEGLDGGLMVWFDINTTEPAAEGTLAGRVPDTDWFDQSFSQHGLFSMRVTAVPEPNAAILLSAFVCCLSLRRRRES